MAKIAIIGAGHNSLVAACYLAKAGHDITIYEQMDHIGGLCSNHELWPEYTVSVWANWYGMFFPEIIRDLDLHLEPILKDVGEITTTADGSYIFNDQIIVPDFSDADLKGMTHYEEEFSRVTRVLRKHCLKLDVTKQEFLRDLETLNLSMPPERMMISSQTDLVSEFTENPTLRALLSANSFIHPCHPGTGYGRAYMGLPYSFENGRWCHIKGGMGKITQELTHRTKELGVTILTSSGIAEILYDGKNVTGFRLHNGECVSADLFICGAHYPIYQRLLKQPAQRMSSHRYGASNIHIRLKKLPTITVVEENNLPYPCTMTLVPTLSEIKDSYASYLKGDNFPRHIISFGIPTLVDPSRAPDDKHLLCLHIDHTPLYEPEGWTAEKKETFVKQIIDEVSLYVPDLTDCIDDLAFFSPQELKDTYGIDDGHCFSGDLVWEFAMEDRIPDLGSGPETTFENMYLCSASCHPGGTVTGVPGYRCAQTILKIIG